MNHREPDFAYETFKCGHIIGLLMLGVLLCQLGSVSVVSSDEVTKYIVFVVLLGLFLPYGIYTTGYLRRASSLDRTLSSIFLFACTVISVIAAVYVVPAFYYVTALLLFVVLICEWVGPLTAYWNGEKVEFSTLKSSSTKPVYGATPYEQPGQPGQPGEEDPAAHFVSLPCNTCSKIAIRTITPFPICSKIRDEGASTR